MADFFTLANAACGAGVFCAMKYLGNQSLVSFLCRGGLAPAALVFDVPDGRACARAARAFLRPDASSWIRSPTSFHSGRTGGAGFAAGLQGGWDWVALLYFVCCGVPPARYNVTAEALSGGEGKVAYFEGTPIPTSVLLVAVLAFAGWQGRLGASLYGGVWSIGPWDLHPLVLLFVLSGTLMISKTLRIPKL